MPLSCYIKIFVQFYKCCLRLYIVNIICNMAHGIFWNFIIISYVSWSYSSLKIDVKVTQVPNSIFFMAVPLISPQFCQCSRSLFLMIIMAQCFCFYDTCAHSHFMFCGSFISSSICQPEIKVTSSSWFFPKPPQTFLHNRCDWSFEQQRDFESQKHKQLRTAHWTS